MRKKVILLTAIIIGVLLGCGKKEDVGTLEDLTVNYRKNPIGTETEPVFSWKMKDEEKGQKQTAYRIVVAESKTALEQKQYVWDSGERTSELSVAIPYEGDELKPETRYFWKVYVKDKDGKALESTEEAYFEIGIMDDDWDGARWICLNRKTMEQTNEVPKDTSYTISFDFKPDNCVSGLIWGADTNSYGNYYLWAFDTSGECVELITSEKRKEKTLTENRRSLEEFGFSKDAFVQKEHSVTMEVNGTHVKTYLDTLLIAEEEVSAAKEMGLLGLWVDRGAFYAYYDNLLVVNEAGEELYREDFENPEENIFSPFYTKVVDGWLKASSGILTVPGGEKPAPMFRKSFQTEQGKKIAAARLYVSAMGIYEAYVNGVEVSKEYFAPGASYYEKEIYYRTYDVTEYIQEGENALGTVLGHGRFDRAKADWGEELALCEKLVIRYEDGSEQTIVSDDSWLVYGDGPVRRDDLFWGEYYDANYEIENWNLPGCAEAGWENAALYTEEKAQLPKKAAEDEPVVAIEELSPVTVTEPEEGCFVYDFGQNFNGICRISVQGEKGQIVTIRFAETLNEEAMSCKDDTVGKIWTQNLYTAQNTDYYVLKGEEKETFSPQFVCRGFRYVQITGLDEILSEEDITAIVLSSENERTGSFQCSEEKVNRLYNNIYWSQLSNYVDIPTDCPQRDERLAWAGDAQTFAPTGSYNANIYTFMEKYLDALRAGQNADGSVQDVGFWDDTSGGNNGWGDAIITIPWTLYQQYGNSNIIVENYSAMCAYMDYLVATSEDYIRNDEGFADHNAMSCSGDAINNTAQCAYAAKLLAKMCRIIGEEEAGARYEEIYEGYRLAWQENYLNDDGSIGEWLPADYVLGLAYGLYPEELEAAGAEKLSIAVEACGFHMNTGYISTPFLLPVLCKYGYTDAAYQLLLQDSFPSWNYMFSHGGTTITEGWNTYSESEDGSYHINGSLNHYALGSVGGWFYMGILGIKKDEAAPAFKHFILEPKPGGGITSASGSYESMYGTIESSWEIEGEETLFRFTIPANTSATVTLPGAGYENMELEAGTYEFRVKQ